MRAPKSLSDANACDHDVDDHDDDADLKEELDGTPWIPRRVMVQRCFGHFLLKQRQAECRVPHAIRDAEKEVNKKDANEDDDDDGGKTVALANCGRVYKDLLSDLMVLTTASYSTIRSKAQVKRPVSLQSAMFSNCSSVGIFIHSENNLKILLYNFLVSRSSLLTCVSCSPQFLTGCNRQRRLAWVCLGVARPPPQTGKDLFILVVHLRANNGLSALVDAGTRPLQSVFFGFPQPSTRGGPLPFFAGFQPGPQDRAAEQTHAAVFQAPHPLSQQLGCCCTHHRCNNNAS